MAFVIASKPGLGDGEGSLGLGATQGSFIAIELDISQNDYDPNNNHVGLDINSVTSVATGNPAFMMASEVPFSVWVEYNGTTSILNVYMAQNSSTKPSLPTLSTSYNITTALLPTNSSSPYFLGFTSATGWFTAQYNVLSWCFTAGQCGVSLQVSEVFHCRSVRCFTAG